MRTGLMSAAVAITMIAAVPVARADMAAADRWVTEEFQPSTLSVEEQMAEMQWFVDAAQPYAGMEINVLSETIPTHTYESTVLAKAAATYDAVVMDSAPVELVSDARVLATQASGVVYVIKADDTPHQAVRQGLSALSDSGTTLLGAVLNQLNPEAVHRYGKYKYGYSRYGRYGHYSYGHTPQA